MEHWSEISRGIAAPRRSRPMGAGTNGIPFLSQPKIWQYLPPLLAYHIQAGSAPCLPATAEAWSYVVAPPGSRPSTAVGAKGRGATSEASSGRRIHRSASLQTQQKNSRGREDGPRGRRGNGPGVRKKEKRPFQSLHLLYNNPTAAAAAAAAATMGATMVAATVSLSTASGSHCHPG